MSVLHLLGSRGDGGVETHFVDLVTALQRTDVRQAAALRDHERREAALVRAGVAATVLDFGGFFDRRTRGRLQALARSQGAHVLLAWNSRAARHAPEGQWARIARVGGYEDLKHHRGFDVFVAGTPDLRDWTLRQGVPPEKALLISNFASTDSAQPLLRSEFDTSEKVPLLLTLGRLHPAKGHDVALKALTRLPDAHLWIAGSGPVAAQLGAHARDLGVADRVRMLGWRDDAAALCRTVDVVVVPSRDPPCSVVLQAWAQGAPVIAADHPRSGAPIAHGEDGLLFPPNDHEALAREVRRITDEPALRYRLVENGRGRIEAEFSEAGVIQQWRELFASFGHG